MRSLVLAALVFLASCAAHCERPPAFSLDAIGPVSTADFQPLSPLDPPAISKQAALALIDRSSTSEEAIQHLENHRFDFRLDRAAIDWFIEHGADQEVLRYLYDRAKAEWCDRRAEHGAQHYDPVIRAVERPFTQPSPSSEYG